MRIAQSLLPVLLAVSSVATSAEQGILPAEPVVGSPIETVTVLDLEAVATQANGPQLRKLFSKPEEVKRIAQKLYVNRLLAREARELGLDQAALSKAVMALRERQYLAQMRLQVLDEEPVPDMSDAAYERYLADPETYSTPTEVRVSHILIRTKNRVGDVRSEEEARKIISGLRERALSGESFEDLAVEYSEDPTAARNKGDLGFFGRGKMLESFEEIAFALREPGEISEVVPTGIGFHILKLHERIDGELKPFDEVKAGIVAELESAFRQQRRVDHVEHLEKETGAVLYEDIFDAYVAEKRALMGIGSEAPAAGAAKP